MNLRGRFGDMVRQVYRAVSAPGSRPPVRGRHTPPQKSDLTPNSNLGRGGMKGKEVWITADGRLRVNRWFSGWREVPSPAMVSLNEYYPTVIDAGGRYSVADLGLDYRDVSRMFGIVRLDHRRAAEIWDSPTSVRGEALAVDLVARELVVNYAVEGKRSSPGLVYPFGSIKAVRLWPEPKLVEKVSLIGGDGLSVRSFPMSMEELAGRIGVPVERCEE